MTFHMEGNYIIAFEDDLCASAVNYHANRRAAA